MPRVGELEETILRLRYVHFGFRTLVFFVTLTLTLTVKNITVMLITVILTQ